MRRIPSTVGELDLRTATAIGLNGRRFFFTTTDDLDANGIPDHQELAPDSPVDLNQAGTPDVDQITELFKALRTVVGEGQVGLATGAETAIRQVASLGPDQFESHGEKPGRFLLGLIGFTVEVENPGDAATLTVYPSEPAPEGYDWYKYEPCKGWYLFTGADFSGDRKSVTITIQDGGHGDFYAEPDSLVVDPGGVGCISYAEPSDGSEGSSSGGGGAGDCLVASMLPIQE
ncbi:MAG: choice-of-anchor U domain-containing protein [Thermodesulfobacteriota bacterium]|nr:choice-of-anchor U domain-containing protein [Thermodesulfobacteriota bacterium]